MADNGNVNGKSRIHIKKDLPELNSQVNVFANDPDEAVALYLTLIDMLCSEPESYDLTKAHHDRINHEQAAEKIRSKAATAQQKSGTGNGSRGVFVNKPDCPNCAYDGDVVLKTFTNKETSEPVRRYICNTCHTWVGKAF